MNEFAQVYLAGSLKPGPSSFRASPFDNHLTVPLFFLYFFIKLRGMYKRCHHQPCEHQKSVHQLKCACRSLGPKQKFCLT